MDLTTQRFMMGASAGGAAYWLLEVSFSGFSSTFSGIKLAFDTSTEDIYTTYYSYQASPAGYRGLDLKVDIDGNVQYLNRAAATYVHLHLGAKMRTDNSGYYILGRHDYNGSTNGPYLALYNTAGTQTWDYWYGTANQNNYATNIDVEPTGTFVFTVGFDPSSYGTLVKWTTGGITAQKYITVPTQCLLFGCYYSSALSSLWFSGRYSSAGKSNVVIGRISDNFATLHQSSTLSNASYSITDPYALTENSLSQAVWAGTQKTNNGDYDLSVAVLNTSGTLVSSAAFEIPTAAPTAAFTEVSSVVTDSSNNIYIVGYLNNDNLVVGYSAGFVLKLNSSLSLQWCNVLYDTTPKSIIFRSIELSSDDSLIVSGVHGDYPIVAKLDPNGGGLGTYGSMIYASQSLNSISSIVSVTTGTVALGNKSESIFTATVSNSPVSHTDTLYDL